MRIIGLDPARPGSDATVMAEMRDDILQAFRVEIPANSADSTVAEVEMRLRDAARTLAPMREHFAAYNRHLLAVAMELRVPCIRYGRRKRRIRLAIPRGSHLLPNAKIAI